MTLSQVWRDRLSRYLASNVGQRELDQPFIDRIQARRAIVESRFWKVWLVDVVLVSALFLNALVISPEFSIVGLKPKEVGATKELILFVAATLSFFLSMMAVERQALKTIALTWAKQKYSPETHEYAELIYGDAFSEFPKTMASVDYKTPTKFLIALQGVWVVLAALFVVGYLAAFYFVYAVAIADVASKPALEPFWSGVVIGYAILAYLTSILLAIILWMPMPYRDYGLVKELTDLQKRSREEYEARIRELAKAR